MPLSWYVKKWKPYDAHLVYMQNLLREDSRKRNEQEGDRTLLGGCTQLYRSRSTHHRRNEPYISGEFTVADVTRARYSELFYAEDASADRWYKVKLGFITLDEKSGAEKKTYTNVLVQSTDLRDAVKRLDEGMKGSMADYIIVSVAETAIMDVYPYEADPDVKPEFPEV